MMKKKVIKAPPATELDNFWNFTKCLVYDIETLQVPALIWRPGKQFVGHSQLEDTDGKPAYTQIIVITYGFIGRKKRYYLSARNNSESYMITQFDEAVQAADFVIGKNNKRFDDKHINMVRAIHGLPPIGNWGDTSLDLEQQLRKFFNAPSMSLDYFSRLFGFGGKKSMEWNDWVECRRLVRYNEIVDSLPTREPSRGNVIHYFLNRSEKEVISEGTKAFKKMESYGLKDLDDTRDLIMEIAKYVDFKINIGMGQGCKHCGLEIDELVLNGTDSRNGVRKQKYWCPSCKKEAGKATLSARTGNPGVIR